MRPKHILLWQLIVLLLLTHTKAVNPNVGNFRSLSYVSDQVAHEIRQMQNGYRGARYQSNYGSFANAFTKGSEEETIKAIKPKTEQRRKILFSQEEDKEVETDNDAKKRYVIKDVEIEFDELVNRVKNKLTEEFKEKNKYKQNVLQGSNDPDINKSEKDKSLSLKNIYKFNGDEEKDNEPRDIWKHFMTTTSQKAAAVTANSRDPHVRRPMKKSKKTSPGNVDDIIEVADLTKVKDSYEDYVTPKRGKIYASDTEADVMNPPKNVDEPNESYKNSHEPNDNYKENKQPHELHGNFKENKERQEELHHKKIPKVADMLKSGRSPDKLRKIRKLDDPISFVSDEYDPYETEAAVQLPEKAMFVKLGGDSDNEKPPKLKGTMIPTRQFFKMSSPNYFAKLPAVAEKYDFNEPLPDKDREPEKIKYYVNPPASINKKVRLQ